MPVATAPQYLSDRQLPDKHIRCPVHGFIGFSPVEQRIIDHPSFQRLRNIRQLAFTYYVYPGAMHTRFEHSLGVMELATHAFDNLVLRNPDLMEENFRTLPAFDQLALAKARQLVRLMGLLHDVGHTAFSHAGEILPPSLKRHENVSAWIVSRDGPLGELIDTEFFDGCSQLLAAMLREEEVPPQLLILKQLVSGQLDLDRSDYLLRDSLHCGVQYGSFDYLRLIQSLVPDPNPDTQSLVIGVDEGGFHAFEALILARYYMNTQVYFHKVRRAYDLMLRHWLNAWGVEHYQSPQNVLDYDDTNLIAQMQRDMAGRDDASPERVKWASRILHRDHPRVIWEFGDHADAEDHRSATNMVGRLQQEFPNDEFFIDDGKGAVHKLFIQGEEELIDDLFILSPHRPRQRLTSRSKIIEKIPKSFRIVRVFGYFANSSDRARGDEIAKAIFQQRR